MMRQFKLSHTVYSDMYIFTKDCWYTVAGDFLPEQDANEATVKQVIEEYCQDASYVNDNPKFDQVVIEFR